jgi:hypothetical protein
LSEKYLKKLFGKADIEVAMRRLDRLTNDEVLMVTAQVLGTAHTIDGGVGRVEDKLDQMECT